MRRSVGAVAVLALVVSVAGCGPGDQLGETDAPWQAVTGSPLSARQFVSVTWVADRFVVVGGDDGPFCPPGADCPVPSGAALRDGATFDPATGAWEPIADAPTPILTAVSAVVGSTLYLLMNSPWLGLAPAFLSYDTTADRWTELPMPPDGDGRLVASGEMLLLVPGSDENGETTDSWFDPATQAWHPLPDDPLGPSFDRSLTVVDGRLILTAKDLVPSPGAHGPSLVRLAELDPTMATWTVLPDSEVIGSDPVEAAGRLVFPDLGSADGGEVGNWGRSYPMGAVYDPAAGTWDQLPEVPGRSSWPRLVVGDRVSVGEALVDPVTGTATVLPADPWADEDQPAVTASPTSIFAWGAMADRSATGYLLTP